MVEELHALAVDAGLSLTHLAIGFVLEYPGVTAPIIGPGTMEQLTDVLEAADLRLSHDVLERIDEIVPPGTHLNEADAAWQPPGLSRRARRRLPAAGDRSGRQRTCPAYRMGRTGPQPKMVST